MTQDEVHTTHHAKRNTPWPFQRFDALACMILLVALVAYLYNLGGWLINDDEGSYLYQAWRISLGEVPYRDFLTPQLPAFLYPGGLLIRLVGPSAVALRTASVMLVMLTAAFLYLTARRLVRAEMALVATVLLLLYPDLYAEGRVYRPEAFQLFFDSVAVYAFLRAHQTGSRRGLVLSGLVFGLAMLSKLFGVLPMAGCGLFLLYRAARRDISWSRFWGDVLALTVPFVGVVGGVLGFFLWVTPKTLDAVLLHHLRQGSQLQIVEVVRKGLLFYGQYFQSYAPLLLFALPAAWQVIRARDSRASFFAWHVPTAFVFLLLSRQLWTRHLLYLAPGLCVLMAQALERLLEWRQRSFLVWAIVGAVAVPWYFGDSIVANYREDGTRRIADFIVAETAPEEYVLSDFSELNFYALRPTGYAASALSEGAASSGQVTGEILIGEIEAHKPPLVIMDTSVYGHLQFLRDRHRFLAYVDSHFERLGVFLRHNQQYAVYRTTGGRPFPPAQNFDNAISLLNADIIQAEAPSGGQFVVRASWQAQRDLDEDYVVFLHLVDDEEHLWGQGDAPLTNSLKDFTSAWLPEEITSDRYRIRVLPGTPPGSYQVRLGLYRRQDGSRLNLLNPAGNPSGTHYTLGTVRVTLPRQPLAAGALILPYPMDVRVKDRVRLLGFDVGDRRSRAGDSLRVTLGWQALQLDGDEHVRLTLQRDDGLLAGEAVYAPGTAAFPTSQWRQGEVVLGQHDLVVDAAAPAGEYTLTVTWLDFTGQPVTPAISLTSITVEALERRFEVPSISHPLQAQVGERVTLLGYDLGEVKVAPGGAIRLTVYWQARGRLSKGYKVFTHVVDDQDRIWGQRDSVPVAGTRPTTSWLPGEVLVDEYTIPLRADVPPGRYKLVAGLYDPLTMERLPVVVDGQSIPERRISLTIVEVGD